VVVDQQRRHGGGSGSLARGPRWPRAGALRDDIRVEGGSQPVREFEWQPVREFGPGAEPDVARGVFETILVRDGRPVEWRRHRERLESSCRDLYDARIADDLDRRVAALSSGWRSARLRVVARPVAVGAVAVAAEVAPLDPDRVEAAGAPTLAPVRVHSGFGRHKLVDRDWLERLEVSVPPGTRPLLVTGAAGVLETTRANVFAVRGDAVATPPLDGSILAGVMRAVLLEQARGLGIPVREAPLALEELQAADAFALTGSLRLVEWRVRSTAGPAGAIVAALLEAVERAVGVRLAAARAGGVAPDPVARTDGI
jgi:branched-subunit amino acid aminotransferase/4-amino-4-deoxychorismate lyase